MGNQEELFRVLVEREVNSSVKAAESMKEVWAIVKDRDDPFSVVIRDVITEKMSDIRRAANGVIQFHKSVFHEICPPGSELSDQLIDFLAAQEKQIRIAEEILREDLNLSKTEPQV